MGDGINSWKAQMTPEEWRDLYANLRYPHPDWFFRNGFVPSELTKDDVEFLAALKGWLDSPDPRRDLENLLVFFGVGADDAAAASAATKGWETWIYLKTGRHSSQWMMDLESAEIA
jgi:hypothetical protein